MAKNINKKDGLSWKVQNRGGKRYVKVDSIIDEFTVPYSRGKIKNIKKDPDYIRIRKTLPKNAQTTVKITRIQVYDPKLKRNVMRRIGVRVVIKQNKGWIRYKRGLNKYENLSQTKRFQQIEEKRIILQKKILAVETKRNTKFQEKRTKNRVERSIQSEKYKEIITVFRVGGVSFLRNGQSNQFYSAVTTIEGEYIPFNYFYNKYLGDVFMSAFNDELGRGRTVSGGYSYKVKGKNKKTGKWEVIEEIRRDFNRKDYRR